MKCLKLSFVDRWPLMEPNDMAFIIAIYLVFVFKIGPMLMEKRMPFQLKGFLVFYNGFKVVNSSILSYKFLIYIMEKGLFPRRCDYDVNTLYVIAILYWKYLITKIIDLFDTIFFVIRKKRSQVTFLHVYHHVFMVIITWCSLKYDPSDHWAFMAIMNCVVHVIMYIYYGISAMGPNYTKYLWWKKYLTMLQLVQFVLVIGHVIIQTSTTECPMGTGTYWIGLANLGLFLCLFTDFYSKRYIYKNKNTTFVCSKSSD
ncbi:elongation of very long chain fatty acids protein 7-like isoform X2 [Danaus plexippus]|uniref:elongation of very long chain fatty acids protein 7-like isoform X2 n=1 Tax=Danaus plexippus TaxID=13037 RepID=UPI002AB2A901|nr:elongation of very long chain fatty acids protein 7-like isoform X2 [Danaus plexippus]